MKFCFWANFRHIISHCLLTTILIRGPRTENSEPQRQTGVVIVIILCIIEDYACFDVITEDGFDRVSPPTYFCAYLFILEREIQ